MAKAAPQAMAPKTGAAFAAMVSPFDVETLSRVNATAFKSFMDTNAKLLAASSAMNAEMVDFVGRRLERDAAVGETLVDCKSLDEACEVCADFVQTSVADYMSEMQKLLSIGEGALNGMVETAATQIEAPTQPSVKDAAAE